MPLGSLKNHHEVQAEIAQVRKTVAASTASGVRMGKTWASSILPGG